MTIYTPVCEGCGCDPELPIDICNCVCHVPWGSIGVGAAALPHVPALPAEFLCEIRGGR